PLERRGGSIVPGASSRTLEYSRDRSTRLDRFPIGHGKISPRRAGAFSFMRRTMDPLGLAHSPKAPRDLAWVAIASVLFAAFSIRFELGERILAWTYPHERFQLDELPAILLVLAC